MAHELTFRDGKAEMFSVVLTPWHREGVILNQAPSFDDGMRLAGLNFTVEKRPLFAEIKGEMKQSDFSYGTYRTDTDQQLGTVGRTYKPIQNMDAFRAIEPLLDSGVAKLETGGSLWGGRRVWLMVKFDLEQFGPICREVFAGETVPFGTVINSHDGFNKAKVMLTPVRIVCANTLAMAEGGKGSELREVTHSGDADQRIIEATEDLLKGLVERYEKLAAAFKVLKQSRLSQADFDRLVVDTISPDPREQQRFNPEAKMAELVVSRHEQRVSLLNRLWVSGQGHTGDHSAWEAYNGAVEAIDHSEELFPNRAGSFRTQSLLTGKLREMKDGAYKRLMSFAGAEN